MPPDSHGSGAAEIDVTYRLVPSVDMWLPEKMTETTKWSGALRLGADDGGGGDSEYRVFQTSVRYHRSAFSDPVVSAFRRKEVLMPKVLTVLLVLSVSMAQSPAPTPADGAIAGQVVDASTGKPVSGVVVSISGPAIPSILTSADGRFLFRDLPPGRFTVSAIKGGYAEGASGRKRIGGASQPVVLTADEPKTADIVVRVWKNCAITGTVSDESGEAVVGVQVRVLARTAASQGADDLDGFVRVGSRPFAATASPSLTDDRAPIASAISRQASIVVAGPPSRRRAASSATIAWEPAAGIS